MRGRSGRDTRFPRRLWTGPVFFEGAVHVFERLQQFLTTPIVTGAANLSALVVVLESDGRHEHHAVPLHSQSRMQENCTQPGR